MEDTCIYVVINEGEPVFASKNEENAYAYADDQGFRARSETLKEWNNDDPTEEDIAEADWQAGIDGCYYYVKEVSLFNLQNNDTIELSDGTEINSLDVLELLEEEKDSYVSESFYEDFDKDSYENTYLYIFIRNGKLDFVAEDEDTVPDAYNDDDYLVEKVSLSSLKDNGIIEFSDGTKINSSDILNILGI